MESALTKRIIVFSPLAALLKSFGFSIPIPHNCSLRATFRQRFWAISLPKGHPASAYSLADVALWNDTIYDHMKILLSVLALMLPILGQSRKHDQLRGVALMEESAAESYKVICQVLEDLGSRRTSRFQISCREMISDLKDQAFRSDEYASSQIDPALIVVRIKAEWDNLRDAAAKAYTYCGVAAQTSNKLNRKDRQIDCEKFKDAAAKVDQAIKAFVEEP